MFAATSHELRTPVNTINNCIKLLESNIESKYNKWTKIAKISCQFLLSMINDILVSSFSFGTDIFCIGLYLVIIWKVLIKLFNYKCLRLDS